MKLLTPVNLVRVVFLLFLFSSLFFISSLSTSSSSSHIHSNSPLYQQRGSILQHCTTDCVIRCGMSWGEWKEENESQMQENSNSNKSTCACNFFQTIHTTFASIFSGYAVYCKRNQQICMFNMCLNLEFVENFHRVMRINACRDKQGEFENGCFFIIFKREKKNHKLFHGEGHH